MLEKHGLAGAYGAFVVRASPFFLSRIDKDSQFQIIKQARAAAGKDGGSEFQSKTPIVRAD